MKPTPGPEENARARWFALAAVTLIPYAAMANHSLSFVYGEGFTSRPILQIVLILLLGGAVYALAVWQAARSPPPLWLVIVTGLILRGILLPSNPIQEDDIYRYMWDGRVAAAGFNPYHFSPAAVDRFGKGGADPAQVPALRRLDELRGSHRAIAEGFSRINHPEYTTIYPPVPQGVFALFGWWVPGHWPLSSQVVAMKCILAVFDAATFVALLILLYVCRKPLGLSVIYAWCPIVLKELSNSGHMDAIPTFFVVAAVAAMIARWKVLTGVLLGAAASSKMFAVLLVPLMVRRFGWRAAAGALCAFAAIVALSAWYIGAGLERYSVTLQAFSIQWEKNDALYTSIVESWRAAFSAWPSLGAAAAEVSKVLSPFRDAEDAPYLAALATVGAACLVVVGFTVRPSSYSAPGAVVARRAALPILALFLLGPLGFPWYFIWCVPFLPFLVLRTWSLLPGLLGLYYLRFWYDYHAGGEYSVTWFGETITFASGVAFFDNVWVWVEFGILFVALSAEWCVRRIQWRRSSA